MSENLSSTQLLELSDYEPETNQVANQVANQTVTHTASVQSRRSRYSENLRSMTIRKKCLILSAVVITLSLFAFNMGAIKPDYSRGEKDASGVLGEQLAPQQKGLNTTINPLLENHLVEKRELIAKQKRIVARLKSEAKDQLATERAAMTARQELQAIQFRNEMEAKLLSEREALIADKAEYARQIQIEMQSKLHAQRVNLIASQVLPEQLPTQPEASNLEDVKKSRDKITAVKPVTANDSETRVSDRNKIAREKSSSEQEQRLIRERLEKLQIIFMAELKKIAHKQKRKTRSVDTSHNRNVKPDISLLFSRVGNGHITYLQKYLKQGGTPDRLNEFGEPLITRAAAGDQFIIVNELLRAGANIDLPDANGEQALKYASQYGHTEMVSLLISKGADIDLSNPDLETALMAASQNGFREVVKILIESGADLNAQDSSGRSALHYALQSGDDLVVALLLDGGADRAMIDFGSTRFDNPSIAKDIAFN